MFYWICIHCHKGSRLILPPGILHDFTTVEPRWNNLLRNCSNLCTPKSKKQDTPSNRRRHINTTFPIHRLEMKKRQTFPVPDERNFNGPSLQLSREYFMFFLPCPAAPAWPARPPWVPPRRVSCRRPHLAPWHRRRRLLSSCQAAAESSKGQRVKESSFFRVVEKNWSNAWAWKKPSVCFVVSAKYSLLVYSIPGVYDKSTNYDMEIKRKELEENRDSVGRVAFQKGNEGNLQRGQSSKEGLAVVML